MFDYLGVLLSVILGLALTHVLLGFVKLIQLRRSVRPYWVQIVWSVSVLLYVLAVWWGMYWWRHLGEWRFEEFVGLTGYAIVLFMMAGMLFPMKFIDGLDFEAYFFDQRKWFFGLFTLALLIDVPETVAKQTAGLRGVPVQYVVFLPFVLTLSVIGWLTSNRRVHGAIAVAYLAAFMAYLTLSSLDRIVVR